MRRSFYEREKEEIRNHSFAVASTYQGAGCTSLCIHFAWFLASYYGKKIAVIECCQASDFDRLEEHLKEYEGFVSQDDFFSIRNIYFYKCISKSRILFLQSEHFDFYIYDMGTEFMKLKEEWIRSEKKIVVGSHCPWHLKDYSFFLQRVCSMQGYEEWEYIDMVSSLKGKPVYIGERQIKLKKLPYFESIFSVCEVVAKIFHSFV